MTLEEISSISQSIAAIAVVASLIFVGIQIRQGEKTQRAVMHDNRLRQLRETALHLASPGVTESFIKGSAADPDITQTEWTQFFFASLVQDLTRDEQYRQFREGLIGRERWQQNQATIAASMTTPGYRAIYQMNRPLLSDQYRSLLDGMLDQVSGQDPSERFKAWRALAAVERAALRTTAHAHDAT